METVGYRQVGIGGGFLKELQDRNAEISVNNIYKRFDETGRFDALDHVRGGRKPHIFWDSDVAKWLESAAYILARREDGALREKVEKTVARILAGQDASGYFNSYYQVYAPEKIFTERTEHELYCAGHLIEAAVALKEAGVDEKLYFAMKKYADYIYERFYVKRDTAFRTCGHPEIELALVRLYLAGGEEKYLTLARFFLDERGKKEEYHYDWATRRYDQSHLPVREQKEAVGHAVRALYLYSAMADVARIDGDAALGEACEALYHDIVRRKMYITGGAGSSHHGEAFTFAYDLPNESAYSETCAAIALAFFCLRLARRKNRAEYHDTIERAFYNNILAGESADGKGFFYVNPLAMDICAYAHNESLAAKQYCPLPERVEVFDCSCCPPNLTRFIESFGDYLYGKEGDVLLVNQYVTSSLLAEGVCVRVTSEMPFGGKVKIAADGALRLKLRVPAWKGGVVLRVNGKEEKPVVEEDYIEIALAAAGEISLDFCIGPRFVYADPRVRQDAGRKAVQYGALVLCGESADNAGVLAAVRIPSLEGAVRADAAPFALDVRAERPLPASSLYSYAPPAYEPFTLRLVPYYYWANRGKGDMQIWWL